MRRWAIRIAVLLGLVFSVILLRVTVLAPEPIPVTVAEVSTGPVEETVTNTRAGTVKARRRAELSPEVGGLVVEIPHREGETVKAGDLLLRLEPRLAEAETELAERDLRTARARREETCSAARLAEREHGRLARLASDQIVSEDVLDQAATAVETTAAGCVAARAAEKRAESAVRLAEVRLEQLVLRAPFEGVIAEVHAEVGEWITPSPPALPVPPVIDILDPSTTFVSAPMDEVDSSVLRQGQPARITVDSLPDRHFPGTVVRVAPYVEDLEEQNRTVEIEARIDETAGSDRILPGTSADVEVFLEVRPDVVRIPTSALVEGGRVFLIEDGTVAEREVEIGLSNWDWTEILSGVEPGDVVVTSLDRAGVELGAQVIAE